MSVNINELSLRQAAGWACLQSNKVIREGRLLSLFQVHYLHSTSMMNLSKNEKAREKRSIVQLFGFCIYTIVLSTDKSIQKDKKA